MKKADIVEFFARLAADNPHPETELDYGSPFELLVIPRRHEMHLQDSGRESLVAIGRGLRDAVGALSDLHGDVAYNLVFHSAPHHHFGPFHWHIHVWPKLSTLAGFERGTGVMINIVAPEEAAEQLRHVGAALSFG